MPDGLRPIVPSCVLMTSDAVGGVWRYSIDLARGIGAEGVRPVLAVLGPPPAAAQRAEALGLQLIETGLPLDWTAESAADLATVTARLQGLAASEKASSVHLHAPSLAGSGGWSVPVVAVAHSCVATWWAQVRGGPLPEDFAWRAAMISAGLRRVDAVIAPTGAHAEAVRRVYGDMKITVVHNGAAAPEAVDAVRQAAVLTAGRLWDEGKNAAALDRVAPLLGVPVRAAGPIEGPNAARAALPNLDMLGTLGPSAMRRAYAEASVFASFARYEPFGLSVLEAAQAGMRLVLSDIPSFRELWDGVARFVADGDDPVPALRSALTDTGDHGATERAGRYDLARMVAGTLAVHRLAGVRV